MTARLEAAATAVAQIETGNDGETVAQEIDRTFARAVLEAADAVTFGQDAIERAARTLRHRIDDLTPPEAMDTVRAVIRALKADQ